MLHACDETGRALAQDCALMGEKGVSVFSGGCGGATKVSAYPMEVCLVGTFAGATMVSAEPIDVVVKLFGMVSRAKPSYWFILTVRALESVPESNSIPMPSDY